MEILQFDILRKFPELVHGVATAKFGNMSYRYGEYAEVRSNRQKFLQKLKIAEKQVVVAQLEHGQNITDVTQKDWGKGVEVPEESIVTDVMATDKPDTFLFLVVADCLALFFYEPVKQVCALAHTGWRGVEQKVPILTIKHLVNNYGCDPKQIIIGMSPAIQKDSARFPGPIEQEKLPGWEPYISKFPDGSVTVDTSKYAYDQIISAGVLTENIERVMIDTKNSSDYFSHRRSAETGEIEARFGCVIGIKN